MIGLPFNDLRCLGSITEVVAELVANRDEVLVELAKNHATVEGLAEWIRTLPQKDDDGEKDDGPKVNACKPPQRLRIPAADPNCVERAALYLAAAELIDPKPVRQLATLDTPLGLHTFPVENGAPIILDPRVPRNCLDAGMASTKKAPIEIEVRDAIEWTAQLAETGAANLRNGPSRVRRARNAMMRLVEEGVAPVDGRAVEDIGWMLALAERVASRFSKAALRVVRTTALALANLAEDAIARSSVRNVALEIWHTRLEPAPWVSMLARIAGRVGMDVGAVALRTKLATLGVGDDMIDLVEQELNRDGLTLGRVARPPRLPTIANFAAKRAA